MKARHLAPAAAGISCALAALLGAVPGAGQGRIEINQARAVAGGVTPGDEPGFPVSITLPGSYVLTSDLNLSAAPSPQFTSAIVFGSSFVTLDLNGFAIRSANQCDGSRNGCFWITGSPAIDTNGQPLLGIVVRNGRVSGSGGSGLDLQTVVGVRIEDLDIAHAGVDGLRAGESAAVVDSSISYVGDVGAILGAAALLRDDALERIGFFAVWVGEGSLVLRNRIASAQSFALGCNGLPPDFDVYALAQNVLVGNNGGQNQFVATCAREIGPNRCDGDSSCP
jgi:hypothetical protein